MNLKKGKINDFKESKFDTINKRMKIWKDMNLYGKKLFP